MAMFRLEAKIFSREKQGKSIIAAAAYRAGKKLKDERDGKIFDYSRRMKGVVESKILVPEGAPDWAKDSQLLWSAVEASEKRKDAQLAREFILAVPPELSPQAQFHTAVQWAKKELVKRGMVAEVSLHHSRDGNNPHVHILTTLRPLEGDKFNAKKAREWNDVKVLHQWRESWADAVNAALEQAGRPERVDHRSLKDQGIDREPEPKIGVAATAMERRGVEADPRRFQEVRHVKLKNDVRPLFKSILKRGEVRQHGVGATWWERSIIFAARVTTLAVHLAHKAWSRFIERSKGDGDEPEHSR